MNILYVHRTRGTGVEAVHIYSIVKALCKLGHNVTVVSPAGVGEYNQGNEVHESAGRGSWVKENKNIFKIISKYMPEMCFELTEILYNFVSYKKISKILKERKYGFIYERYAIFSWAGVKAAKKNNIPIIMEINYTSYTPLYRKRSNLLKPLAHWIDKRIFGWANGFVAVSTYLKNHLVNLKVPAGKIVVLTNAADPDKFNHNISGDKVREKYNIKDKKVIGFSGGFYPWHGLDLLIETFIDLKKDYENIVLMLIGDGPLKVQLEKKVSEFNIANHVIFTGKVDHEKLPAYIAAFDIAVMPNSNNYGSPMKVFEYMAMGKPVVAPRLGPLEDAIENGKEGILFEPKDIKNLTRSFTLLIVNDEKRKIMGINGREKVVKRHLWGHNAASILDLFKGLS